MFIDTIGGHIGYLRQAVERTPGVSEYRKSSFNGHAGVNTSLTVEFERDDEALYEQLLTTYRAICQEKRPARKERRSETGRH